jgi:protein phosphatase 1 regulatory subunit 37
MYHRAARTVRTSSLRNISLRHNRINATGAIALAVMIRDYPDIVPGTNTPPPSVPSSPTPSSLSHITSPPSTPTTDSSRSIPAALPPPIPNRAGPVPPPPRHPATAPPQTTYTPYIPRSRRGAPVSATPNPLSPSGHPIPIITSSAQGGITTRHPVSHSSPSHGQDPSANQPRHVQGPSAALLDKVRALDALPRLGALRTLDLKGNDLRVSFPMGWLLNTQ